MFIDSFTLINSVHKQDIGDNSMFSTIGMYTLLSKCALLFGDDLMKGSASRRNTHFV